MPLQNRVTPLSEIVAYTEHGLFMGNRGCLHDDNRQIVRHFKSKRWIICLTSFNDRKRALMSPKQYTELFFLDEATALAAGHRPCFTCRQKEHASFKEAWVNGNPNSGLTDKSSIDKVDTQLHYERLTPDGQQQTYRAALGELPSGTFSPQKNVRAHCFAGRKAYSSGRRAVTNRHRLSTMIPACLSFTPPVPLRRD